MNSDRTRKLSIERVLIVLSYLAYSLYVLIQAFPDLSTQIIIFSVFIAGLTLFVSIMKNRTVVISSCKVKYQLGIWCIVVLMIITSLIYRSIYSTYGNIGYYIIDILAVITLLCGDAFIIDESIETFENLVFTIGFISCIIGVFALTVSNFQVVVISDRRENTRYIQYYLWKLMEIWPYLIVITVLRWKDNRKNKFKLAITIVLAIEYFILSVLFLKRVVYFDIAVLLLIAILVNTSHRKQLLKTLVYICTILLGVYLMAKYLFSFDIMPYISLTFSRFDNNNISEFDRFKEFTNLFDQFDWEFVITGMGFGSAQNGPGGGHLHLGLLNLIFKGGIPFFLIIVGIGCKSLKIVRDRNVPITEKIHSSIVLYTLLRSLVSPFWQPNPTRIIFSICIILMLNQYDKLYKTRGVAL